MGLSRRGNRIGGDTASGRPSGSPRGVDADVSAERLDLFGEFNGRYGDLELTLQAFLWSFGGDLSRFVQREGAGMELVSAAEMVRRTEPGSPDYALASGLEARYSTPSRFSSS